LTKVLNLQSEVTFIQAQYKSIKADKKLKLKVKISNAFVTNNVDEGICTNKGDYLYVCYP